MRKSEVNAVAAILKRSDEYESAEDAAAAIITELENLRAGVTTYAGIIELDLSGPPLYTGVGYFPGEKSARSGILKHPAAGMAKLMAVVPVVSPKGLTLQLAALDQRVKDKGDFELVQEDAKLFKLGWDGKQGTRKQYLDMIA